MPNPRVVFQMGPTATPLHPRQGRPAQREILSQVAMLRGWTVRSGRPHVTTVEDRPELGRYQLSVGGDVAGYLAYEMHGDRFALMHTQIEDQFAGQGLGAALQSSGRSMTSVRKER